MCFLLTCCRIRSVAGLITTAISKQLRAEVVFRDFTTALMQYEISVISIGDKITGAANAAVTCCLHSINEENATF